MQPNDPRSSSRRTALLGTLRLCASLCLTLSACDHYGEPYSRWDAEAVVECDDAGGPIEEDSEPDDQAQPSQDGAGADAATSGADAGGKDASAASADGGARDASTSTSGSTTTGSTTTGSTMTPDAGTGPTTPAGMDAGGSTTLDAGGSTAQDAGRPTPDTGIPTILDAGPLNEPLACLPCETSKIPNDSACFDSRSLCTKAKGTAAKGPKAGAAKSALCMDVLKCIFATNCAYVESTNTNDNAQCLCGKGKGADCLTSDMPIEGACKDPIFAAAESTDRNDLLNRTGDLTYAVGAAFGFLDCDSLFCGVECGLSKATP